MICQNQKQQLTPTVNTCTAFGRTDNAQDAEGKRCECGGSCATKIIVI